MAGSPAPAVAVDLEALRATGCAGARVIKPVVPGLLGIRPAGGSTEPAGRDGVGRGAQRKRGEMPSIVGTVLLVQESRFRLLTEHGRGETFLLSHAAPIEPQDLPPLAGRRVRVHYGRAAKLLAFVAWDLEGLDEEGATA